MFLQRLSTGYLPFVSHFQRCPALRTYQRLCKYRQLPRVNPVQAVHTTSAARKAEEKDLQPSERELLNREQFFDKKDVKNKETLLQIIDAYNKSDPVKKRGHIEFIYAALHHLSEFGAEAEAQVYNRLMDVFPKGKMVPRSLIQAEFMHFSRHQECGIYLLDHMEHQGLIPDREMKETVLAVFGQSSIVYKKLSRMLYWMPKLKNLNPYPLPDPLPTDPRELARLALQKMARDKRTTINEYDTELLEGCLDKTWVLSAQSPTQCKLLSELPEGEALWVEGPSLVWLRKVSMTYFVLRAESKIYPKIEVDDDDVANLSLHMFGEPKQTELTLTPQSIHEQEDGLVLAICCTGTSSKDSLLSWVRLLQGRNPRLESLPVLFKLRTSPKSVVTSVNAPGGEMDEAAIKDAVRAEKEAARQAQDDKDATA